MVELKRETKLMIDSLPDGKFTFQVMFRGELQPVSRVMDSREDAEWLGYEQIKHLERRARSRQGVVEFPGSFTMRLF